MTLSEIETILIDLRKRHTNLDKELLTTILTASGWEDKTVKDALALFSQQEKRREVSVSKKVSESVQKESTLGVDSLHVERSQPQVIEEHKPETSVSTFVETNTLVSTEKIITTTAVEKSHVVSSTREYMEPNTEATVPKVEVVPPVIISPVAPTVEALKEVIVESEPKKEVVVEVVRAVEPKEQESLIVPKKEDAPRKISEHIPEDLPLLPFESSPHVWSFSRYKDVFHGEVMPKKEDGKEIKEIPVVITVEPVAVAHVIPTPVAEPVPTYQIPPARPIAPIKPRVFFPPEEDEEVSLEKVPMTRGDESLVFLAGVMLLGIILILGYMYSNGRL